VFLDSKCLLPGDDWDQELAAAQRNSLITVVLISAKTNKAYYQREEIAAAIAMAREDKKRHRVIPVYLEGSRNKAILYGLRLKHGIDLVEQKGMLSVAQKLIDTLHEITKNRIKVKSENSRKKKVFGQTHEKKLNSTDAKIYADLGKVLSIFEGEYIFPYHCDESKRILQEFQQYFQTGVNLTGNDSKNYEITYIFRIQEQIEKIVDMLDSFRKICLQDNENAKNLKQEILNGIQNILHDMKSTKSARDG
jgi:hypothetical protein